MERRSFFKKVGLAGLVAAPAAATAAAPPKPKADIFGRGLFGRRETPGRMMTPGEFLDRWYEMGFTGAPTRDMQAMVTDEFVRIVPEPHLRMTSEAVRTALTDQNVQAIRFITPRFVIDLYDNTPRPPHIVAPVQVPLATVPMNHYIHGSGPVINRIKSALLTGVRDLVEEVQRNFEKTAMMGPEVCCKLEGPMLEFYLFTHVLKLNPPQQMPGEGRVA